MTSTEEFIQKSNDNTIKMTVTDASECVLLDLYMFLD